MADIYQADRTPTKREVLASVLDLEPAEIEQLASYRFDDPDGAVGIEIFIVRTPDGTVVQIPVTYRGAPLEEADSTDLIAKMDHSVLGKRYVYLASADPVFAEALVTTITEAGTSARQVQVDAGGDTISEITEGLVTVRGTGAAEFDDDELGDDVCEVVEMFAELDLAGLSADEAQEPGQLVGTWEGQNTPVLLAHMGLVFDDADDYDDFAADEEL